MFVQLSGTLGLVLASSFVAYYDKIQHKGMYYLTILIAISALHVLKCMRESHAQPWRFAGKWIAIVFFILAYSRMAYIDIYLIDHARRESIAGFGL